MKHLAYTFLLMLLCSFCNAQSAAIDSALRFRKPLTYEEAREQRLQQMHTADPDDTGEGSNLAEFSA